MSCQTQTGSRGGHQDGEMPKLVSKGHSRPVKRRGVVSMEQRKEANKQGALTSCQAPSVQVIWTAKLASVLYSQTVCVGEV
jgi:hypothetical protein